MFLFFLYTCTTISKTCYYFVGCKALLKWYHVVFFSSCDCFYFTHFHCYIVLQWVTEEFINPSPYWEFPTFATVNTSKVKIFMHISVHSHARVSTVLCIKVKLLGGRSVYLQPAYCQECLPRRLQLSTFPTAVCISPHPDPYFSAFLPGWYMWLSFYFIYLSLCTK